jgi:hypothetical protein
MNTGPRVSATLGFRTVKFFGGITTTRDLVDKTALIKSLKEPEDKIGEPSPIRGNKFYHLNLEDFKETGDETFAWESFEKKLSAYSFLKYLVQENDILKI